MASATRHSGGGFRRGLAFGLVLAVALLGLLAVLFPPVRYVAPDLPPGVEIAPHAPWQPSAGRIEEEDEGLLTPPPGGLLGGAAPAPLVIARPAADMAPGLAKPQGPDVFQGRASGSPSLVPLRTP